MSVDVAPSSDLIQAILAGSLEALGDLYRRHADDVLATAYRLSGSVSEAEDILQDVFVGLPRALEKYSEEERFGGWLNRVTVRTALMRLRSRRRRLEQPLETVAPRADHQIDPLDRLEAANAVAALPESLRLVFVLKEIEGYSHDEVGELLGISPNASAVRLARAWTRLRKELK